MKTLTVTMRRVLPCVLSFVFCTAVGNLKAAAAERTGEKPSSESVRAREAFLKKFLLSTEGTAGWAPAKGKISYDFLPDGRLHIQGPDGEATMWQGKWSLLGDQLTLINSDTKKKKTVTAVIAGKDLLLDGARYHRIRL